MVLVAARGRKAGDRFALYALIHWDILQGFNLCVFVRAGRGTCHSCETHHSTLASSHLDFIYRG